MASAGVRVGIVGATGALGGEVLRAVEASQMRVREVVAVATDRSLGSDIEFEGEAVPVLAELPSLRGLDLVVLCAPAHVSLEVAREALRAEVMEQVRRCNHRDALPALREWSSAETEPGIREQIEREIARIEKEGEQRQPRIR